MDYQDSFFSLASQGVHKVPFGILIRLVFAFGLRSAVKFEFWPSRGEKSGHHWHRIKNQGVMLSRLVYCHRQKYAGGLFNCSEKLKDVTAPLPVWSDRLLWLAYEGDLLRPTEVWKFTLPSIIMSMSRDLWWTSTFKGFYQNVFFFYQTKKVVFLFHESWHHGGIWFVPENMLLGNSLDLSLFLVSYLKLHNNYK